MAVVVKEELWHCRWRSHACPRQEILLGIWQTKLMAGLGLQGQASEDSARALPEHGGGPCSKAGESLPGPGSVSVSGLPLYVGRDKHLPFFLP